VTSHSASPSPSPVVFEISLGRETRAGDWEELSRGTYRTARDAFLDGHLESAALLVEQAVLEAEELHDIYDRWPEHTRRWILERGASEQDVARETTRLTGLVGQRAMDGIDAEWALFTTAVARAARLCRTGDRAAPVAIEEARVVWLGIHDRAVDRVSGLVDIAVRLVGEASLGALWDHLMADWYAAHRQRYAPHAQEWPESARQLMVAIVDGFHAHLTGPDRSGDLEVIQEADRIGFRFAPCGSGGRAVASGITAGSPRAAAPYGFAVTTEKHDWAWNKVGICSYCVHCCQLNVVMPIDALGFPTRVIDPPTWPAQTENPSCTWWVYRHPSLVPAAVYEQVGRAAPVGTTPKDASA
jgi:hypothetical protein